MPEWKDPLMNAVENGEVDRVKQLMNAKHSPDGTVDEKYCPIHLAVIRNDLVCCKILLENGANVDKKDLYTCTALHRASLDEVSLEIFKLLICNGADVNAKTASYITPLLLSAQVGQLEKFHHLLNYTNAIVEVFDKHGRNVIYHLLQGKNRNVASVKREIELVIQRGASINVQDYLGNTVLDYADSDSKVILVGMGADVSLHDVKGNDYIHRHMLLDISNDHDSFLKNFLENGLQLFSKEEVSGFVNKKGYGSYTPFLRSCALSFTTTEILGSFLAVGGCVDSETSLGQTPLHLMSRDMYIPNVQSIEVLLKHGAKINARDLFGRTPIYKFKFPNILELCLKYNADLQNMDRSGRSPLMALMSFTNLNVLSVLVRGGAKVNTKDEYLSTPLHYAVWHKNIEILRFVLQNSGDTFAVDVNGNTPKDLAIELKNDEAVRTIDDFEKDQMKEKYEVIYDRKLHEYEKSLMLCDDAVPMKFCPLPLIECKMETLDLESVLKNVPNHTNYEQFAGQVLHTSGIGKVNDEDKLMVNDIAVTLVNKICIEVGKKDWRFKSTILQSGSMAEGSKCGYPDEFDFMCCLEEFGKVSDILEEDNYSDLGLAQLVLKDKNFRRDFGIYFHDNDTIDIDAVTQGLLSLMEEVTLDVNLWDHEGIFFDGYIKNVFDKPTFNLVFDWVGIRIKHLRIKVDIVPAVRKRGWWPRASNIPALPFFTEEMKIEGCILLIEHLPSVPYHLRISFAPVEILYFKALPKVLRHSYILAKAMRHESVCPPISFHMNDFELGAESCISSYMLKICLFHAVSVFSDTFPIAESPGSSYESLVWQWACLIYTLLGESTKQTNLPHVFLKLHNVLKFSYFFQKDIEDDGDMWKAITENNKRRSVFLACIQKALGVEKITNV